MKKLCVLVAAMLLPSLFWASNAQTQNPTVQAAAPGISSDPIAALAGKTCRGYFKYDWNEFGVSQANFRGAFWFEPDANGKAHLWMKTGNVAMEQYKTAAKNAGYQDLGEIQLAQGPVLSFMTPKLTKRYDLTPTTGNSFKLQIVNGDGGLGSRGVIDCF